MKIIRYIGLILLIPSNAHANVVWPALYLESKINTIPIIVLSLSIEFFVYKHLFKITAKKALLVTIAANIISGVIGLIARPLSGILYELSLGMLINMFFDWGTFNPVAWCFVPVFSGATNALIELFMIKAIWKYKISKKTFLWGFMANLITAIVATIWVIIQPPEL